MPETTAAVGYFVLNAVGAAAVADAAGATLLYVVGTATIIAAAKVASNLMMSLYDIPTMDSDASRQANQADRRAKSKSQSRR